LGGALRTGLAARHESIIVPHLLDVEVMSALRNLTARRRLDPHHTSQLLAALSTLPAERVSHMPYLARIWELRHNFTAYDAVYIALAEHTESVLYTCDEKAALGTSRQSCSVSPAGCNETSI
jgi:predicted nucleic acid-binding protein